MARNKIEHDGKTYMALNVYKEQVSLISRTISSGAGVDYATKVKMGADHFADKVETAGKFLYD